MIDVLQWVPVIALASIPMCIGVCVLIAIVWSDPPEDRGM